MPPRSKECTGCGDVKYLTEFAPHKRGRGGRTSKCRACRAEQSRRWRRENPDKARAATRSYRERNLERSRETTLAWQVRERYGLTLKEYKARLTQPCDICGRFAGTGPRGMHIDHDHKTGTVRGVLCATCNIGVGHFQDDPKLLRDAANYLEGAQGGA